MKRLFSRVIAFGLTASISTSAFLGTALASDSPSDWAASQVNEAISYGLIPEEIQGRYQDNITREEFAILMDELCNDYSGGKMTFIHWDNYNSMDGNPFNDTENSAVKRMYCAGIMAGIGDGKFGSNQPLTREQAAAIMVNFANFIGKPLPSGNVTFSDKGNVSSWAIDGVGSMQASGIMNGVGNNNFAPKNYYTREQSIVTAFNMYKFATGSGNSTNGSSNTGNNSATAPSATGDSFQSIFQQIYDNLSAGVDAIEIANATDNDLPNSDTFISINSDSLRSQYPDQTTAIGYLEAARAEMIDACVCGINIDFYGQMGYTRATLTRRVNEEREKIDGHVEKAREYLQKAQNSIK